MSDNKVVPEGPNMHHRSATVVRKPPRLDIRCTSYSSNPARRGAIALQDVPEGSASSSEDEDDFHTADELDSDTEEGPLLVNRGHVAKCASLFQAVKVGGSSGESSKVKFRRQSDPPGSESSSWASQSTDGLASSVPTSQDGITRRESSIGGRNNKDSFSKAMSYMASPSSNLHFGTMFSERPVDVPEGAKGTFWSRRGGSQLDIFTGLLEPIILKDRFAQIKIGEMKKGAEQKKTKKNFHAALTNKIIAVYKNEESFMLSQLTIALDLKGAKVERKVKGRRAFAFQLMTILQQRVVFTGEEGVVDRWLVNVSEAIKRLNEDEDTVSVLGDTGKKHFKLGRTKSAKEEPKTEETEQRRKLRSKLKKFFHRRPTIESIKMSGIYKDEPVFGSSLPSLCAVDGLKIPRFVQAVVEVIESKEENLKTDGLYRASGNLSQVQRIRCYADQDRFDVMKTEEDIHVLTGALKLFFRELKEPLIPACLIRDLLRGANTKNKQERLPIFKRALEELEDCYRETYLYVLKHLQKVVGFSSFNRMDEANISIVFGPTLMWLEMDSPDMASELMNRNLIVQVMLRDLDDILSLIGI